MIVVTFTFNGQYQMLKLQLQYLSLYVDKILIVQANRTFSGFKKPVQYYFDYVQDHIDMRPYKDKVIYHRFDAQKLMIDKRLRGGQFLRYRDITSWYIQNEVKISWIDYAKQMCQNAVYEKQQIYFIVQDIDQFLDMERFSELERLLQSHSIIKFDGTRLFKLKFNYLQQLVSDGCYLSITNVKKLYQEDKGLKVKDWYYIFNKHLYSIGVVKNIPIEIENNDLLYQFSSVMPKEQFIMKHYSYGHYKDIIMEHGSIQNFTENFFTKQKDKMKVIPWSSVKINKTLKSLIEYNFAQYIEK